VRKRFPPPSLKQLEDVLQEEWYKIPLEIVQNLQKSIPRTSAVLKTKMLVEHHINKERYTLPAVFPLFCPTPVYIIFVFCERHIINNFFIGADTSVPTEYVFSCVFLLKGLHLVL
jgi:hypothetical protein